MMNVFVGMAALFVAIGIWRGKGLFVWTAAIVFFCLSISDHVDAITVRLLGNGPHPASMSGALSGILTMLVVMSLVEAIAIFALTSKSMRDHNLTLKAAK